MEKVIIYATAAQGAQEAAAYEEAINQVNKGNDVLFLYCDKVIGGCLEENPSFCKYRCKICVYFQKKRSKKYLPQQVKYKPLSDYWNQTIEEIVKRYEPKYADVKECRSLTYKGVNIGYGALSTYISLTRNPDPVINSHIRTYLDKLLTQQVVITELFLQVVREFNPSLIIFHNGRLAQYKPFLNTSEQLRIPFITTESFPDVKGVLHKNYFFNTMPHNAKANVDKYNLFWNNYIGDDREKIGRSFYENKRIGGFTGGKIFTDNMEQGKLPDEWNPQKRHIVIFNSSEDEYSAINKDVDSAALFPSQVIGISKIVDRLKSDDDVQVFLRIHPNLSSISYSYHTDLYYIKANNFFIVPPKSKVSSYTLMDNADLIIVFGSTIGIESAYWGKPVICLAFSFYALLDVVYLPKSENELWKLLYDRTLKPKDNRNCLKFGLFYVSEKHEEFIHTNLRYVYRTWRGKQFRFMSYLSLFGSPIIYHIIHVLLDWVFRSAKAIKKLS